MMKVRYKLRKAEGLITPQGPNFSQAKRILCDINGTVIKFSAPKHQPRHTNDKPVLPACAYKLDEIAFRSNYQEGFNVSDNWKTFKLYYNAWAFYGSWFTGVLAELEMSCTLIKPINYENEDFSLFHPRAFEKIIGDYLTNDYSMLKSKMMGGGHHYIAPVNWQPLADFSSVAVKLEVRPDVSVINRAIEYLVFFPITHKVMVCIRFIPSQLLNLSQKELDKRVDRSTMLELMENIINSIEVTLSPGAQAQQKAALAGLDDVSLIKDFPPLKWDESDADLSSKELPAK